MVGEEVDFTDFDRAAVVLAKNVMKQKIREAEKALVYEEYCDKVDEMVLGTIETVEEKFVIVNIGKTFAMMKKSAQIPTEHYKEGDNYREKEEDFKEIEKALEIYEILKKHVYFSDKSRCIRMGDIYKRTTNFDYEDLKEWLGNAK